ncbi:hypothetical protein, partial [Salipaludibacillus sp. CF4.18]|uniref:hypothetical protein n=1 Tax=Salipaludibacillus sp. CF4.18 TaxID=3373081 RepID=UPI003EE61E01
KEVRQDPAEQSSKRIVDFSAESEFAQGSSTSLYDYIICKNPSYKYKHFFSGFRYLSNEIRPPRVDSSTSVRKKIKNFMNSYV